MRRSAFTLVEVLLAVAILGSVLAAAHMVMVATISAREHVGEAGDRLASAQALLWLMEQDLRGAVADPVEARAFEAVVPDRARADGAFLSFVTAFDPRSGWGAAGAGSGLFRVSYRLRRAVGADLVDGEAGWVLERAQSPWRNGGTVETGAYEQVQTGVADLQATYLTDQGWDYGRAHQDALPRAVRITLAVAGGAAPFEQLVWLPASPPPGREAMQ